MTKTKAVSRGRFGKIDVVYFLVALLIAAVGIICMISSSMGAIESEDYKKAIMSFLGKEIVTISIGLLLSTGMVFLPWKWFYKLSIIGYGGMVLLMLFTSFFGNEENGARRWIFHMQPSEFSKLALILILAKYITDLPRKQRVSFKGTLQMLLLLVPLAVIAVVGQKHLSVAIIYCCITGLMLFISGMNRAVVAIGIPAGAVAIILTIILGDSFRIDRITGWLHTFEDGNSTSTGWQVVQSLYAISSGGLFGRGLGQSREKYAWLPEAENDYIFSIFAEEFGLIGCIVLLILFVVFIWRGIVITIKAPNTFLTMVALGITVMFASQVLLNVCIVTNLLPPTGIQLPFFSSGGSSWIVCIMSVGIMLNISKQNTN